MRYNKSMNLASILLVSCTFLLSACSPNENSKSPQPVPTVRQMSDALSEPSVTPSAPSGTPPASSETGTEKYTQKPDEPFITSMDWSDYFSGLNGAAVFYDSASKNCAIYNQELAREQRSPCSTFKIISSLIGLESGNILPNDSTRTWSGEHFWNEAWNKDIDFAEAFRTSCVWYYRELIDEIGPERIESELNRLQYGNKDISDWKGELNTNNNNRALTGFWIESSLKISAAEQVRVMEDIFGTGSVYRPETIEQLKQVMLITDYETEYPIYGKTGMGKENGIVVDSWFTGFAETEDGNLYFCIYLGETDGADVSSSRAKEIAVGILADIY